MKKVFQNKFVKYNEQGDMIERGNCLASVIASIMELPLNQVPNIEELFYIQDSYWLEVLLTWLESKGWEKLIVDIDFLKNYKDYYLVTGKSPRGDFNHIVIYKDGILAHDPYKDGHGIVGEPVQYQILQKKLI